MIPRGLVARITLPPLVGVALLASYVVVEALGYRGLAVPEAETVAEAAAMGDAARALELIASGQDADSRQTVRAGILDHESRELAPLEAAIIGRHAELVRLLQRSGATHWDARRAACFARMRLPEVLSDVATSQADVGDGDADVETTMNRCAGSGTPR